MVSVTALVIGIPAEVVSLFLILIQVLIAIVNLMDYKEGDPMANWELVVSGTHGVDQSSGEMTGAITSAEQVQILPAPPNLVLISLDNIDLTEFCQTSQSDVAKSNLRYELLNVHDIVSFAQNISINKIKSLLYKQLKYNIAITEERLAPKYGESLGRMIIDKEPLSLKGKAKAYAAAGSDARMNGAPKEVCIISGSGNQGITTVLPVYIYVESLGVS